MNKGVINRSKMKGRTTNYSEYLSIFQDSFVILTFTILFNKITTAMIVIKIKTMLIYK